jgi:hypothetical protein
MAGAKPYICAMSHIAAPCAGSRFDGGSTLATHTI